MNLHQAVERFAWGVGITTALMLIGIVLPAIVLGPIP